MDQLECNRINFEICQSYNSLQIVSNRLEAKPIRMIFSMSIGFNFQRRKGNGTRVPNLFSIKSATRHCYLIHASMGKKSIEGRNDVDDGDDHSNKYWYWNVKKIFLSIQDN